MNNMFDEIDIFEALQIPEEWEVAEDVDPYAKEDAQILKEYGY